MELHRVIYNMKLFKALSPPLLRKRIQQSYGIDKFMNLRVTLFNDSCVRIILDVSLDPKSHRYINLFGTKIDHCGEICKTVLIYTGKTSALSSAIDDNNKHAHD